MGLTWAFDLLGRPPAPGADGGILPLASSCVRAPALAPSVGGVPLGQKAGKRPSVLTSEGDQSVSVPPGLPGLPCPWAFSEWMAPEFDPGVILVLWKLRHTPEK